MIHPIVRIIAALAALATIASLAYYVLCLIAASRFAREQESGASTGEKELPGISILKPLKGTDPQMYESLRSHCLLDYPEYEIVFGVSDPQDPAIALVKQLQNEFPTRNIRLVFCEKSLGTNVKVSNLAQMLPEAHYEYLIVNDSDIRVDADYLHHVLRALMQADVGLVTCLYRGVSAKTLGSRLEGLGISTDFCVGVLVARFLEDVSFGLGSTLAFRRGDLNTIGGFEILLDYLADDYEIGNRIAARGLQVKISKTVVETYLPAYSFSDFFRHQMRWARSVRDSRKWGYIGLGITFGVPWAVLALLANGTHWWSWALFAVTCLVRGAVAVYVGSGILKDRSVVARIVLLPLRDFVALLVWTMSFGGHTVTWRGDSFRLKDGKLIRA